MRYVVLGARILEGLIFLVFGLNGILHISQHAAADAAMRSRGSGS